VTPPPGRLGIALALGGGAALGWAHLGVLAVLREGGVPIAGVAGTSIGALAGVCLAADRLDVLEGIARGATRRRVLSYLDPHWGRGAWLGGRRIARELAEHLGERRLEALDLPCTCVAADLDTGEEVRLSAGPVPQAVQASMAIPGLFRPARWEGRTLIDGGWMAVLPLAAAAALCPGRPVVAVDLFGDHLPTPPRERRSLGVAGQAFTVILSNQTRLALRLHPPAVLIRPKLGQYGTGSFGQADRLIALGRQAAAEAIPAIRAVLSSSSP
jgi:NTE family protein